MERQAISYRKNRGNLQSFLREREEGIAMPVVRDTRPSQDVLSKIEEAKNRRDWFFAVVYSSIHIERQAS